MRVSGRPKGRWWRGRRQTSRSGGRQRRDPGRRGGPSGDLYVFIDVLPDDTFQREGNDVYCETAISFTQAALGADIEVPGLETPQKLTIPKGTQTGKVFKIQGAGIPALRGYGRGDQFVRVLVETPTDLSDEEERLLRQFADLRGEKTAAKKKGLLNSIIDSLSA